MSRSHEVSKVQPLLKADGTLREPGWSRRLYQVYDRNAVKAPRFLIKEWDYYLVLHEDYALAFTVSDDGYIGLHSVSLLDFKNATEHTETILEPFPMGKRKMPATSERGNVSFHNKRLKLDFYKEQGRRRIVCEFLNFWNGENLQADITLHEPDMDTMVIATPWKEKKTAFYYNQKINCMRAEGKATFGGREFVFSPETDFGTLDWGRGVWTYKNRWYWGSGNGVVDGKPFGFNLGYGFGDTSAASENVIFYDGRAHKFDDVVFHIPESGGHRQYLSPWKVSSSDGRFEADFMPVLDRAAKIDVKLITTDQHQVFGRMSGKAVLDDGRVLEFGDLMCFAEDVFMKY